jgi:hypothetical protein
VLESINYRHNEPGRVREPYRNRGDRNDPLMRFDSGLANWGGRRELFRYRNAETHVLLDKMPSRFPQTERLGSHLHLIT